MSGWSETPALCILLSMALITMESNIDWAHTTVKSFFGGNFAGAGFLLLDRELGGGLHSHLLPNTVENVQ
jgi:hypothetical protein